MKRLFIIALLLCLPLGLGAQTPTSGTNESADYFVPYNDRILPHRGSVDTGAGTMVRASGKTYVNASDGLVTTESLGSELVTNGDMSTACGVDWTCNAQWNIAAGVATHTPGATDSFYQDVGDVLDGLTFKVTYTISNRTAGGAYISVGGNQNSAVSTNTTTTFYITGGSASTNIAVYGGSAFDGDIDDVSVKQVTNDYAYDDQPAFETVGGRPSISVEPAGTNLVTYSEIFRDALGDWVGVQSTVTDDATVSPDGNATADKLKADATADSNHYTRTSSITIADNGVWTASVYMKQSDFTWGRIFVQDTATAVNNVSGYFDLSGGVVGTLGDGGSGTAGSIAIEPSANGFYRCSITGQLGAGITTAYMRIYVAEADTDVTLAGTVTGEGIYVWGAQVEESPVPTSYIPTVAASATRATEAGHPYYSVPLGSGTRVEDFGDYSETDAPGKVTIDGNLITLTAGDRDEDYYVTRDLGAGYFGDFTHEVDVNVTALTDDGGSATFPWALSNANDDLQDIIDASGDWIGIRAQRQTSDTHYALQLKSVSGGTPSSPDTSSAISVGTKSYLSISRSGTTFTVEIYSSDALRTAGAGGDVDTITGTSVNTAFQFVYGIASRNNATTAKDISGTVENLSIGTKSEMFEEKLGQELWDADAAVFTSGTYSWVAYGNNTIANVANELVITAVDNNAGAYVLLEDAGDLSADLVPGTLYKLAYDAKYTGGDGVEMGTWIDGDAVFQALTTSMVTYKTYFVASGGVDFIRLSGFVAGETVNIDNLSLKEVTNAWNSLPPHGTMLVWWMPGFGHTTGLSGGILSLTDSKVSIIRHSTGNAILSTDGTLDSIVTSNWTAYTWYKLALQWGYLTSNVSQFRVGIEAEGSAFDSNSWDATPADFDGAFTVSGNELQIGYGLFGPMHVGDLRLFRRILSDAEINAIK